MVASTSANVLPFPAEKTSAATSTEGASSPNRAQVIAMPSAPASAGQQVERLLANQRIGLQYQPQIDLRTGALSAYEALLRIRGQDNQLLNTADVISATEQSGRIGLLGSLVLNRACQEFASLRQRGLVQGRLAVNLSPLELRDADYVDRVVQALADADLGFSDLELEITESWSLDDSSLHLGQLHELADLGVRLAVDDFGAGHAAWAHVLKLPVSTLKIDRSLVTNIMLDRRAHTVVKSICDACHDLDLAIVAEGVSGEAQFKELQDLGCTYGQGFGLYRPMDAKDLLSIKPLTFAC